ncbi:hypothetical protein NDU88_011424 [Pleurodeles waltl]|uniref:Uncharacterized protein n=1 Tax=Pleurodeles waltl TaxID=8319 RepID=A0AAV7QZY8_PLEWA|nr:hypothetical protein NDU88_011424 [Pleurodeles waltl]
MDWRSSAEVRREVKGDGRETEVTQDAKERQAEDHSEDERRLLHWEANPLPSDQQSRGLLRGRQREEPDAENSLETSTPQQGHGFIRQMLNPVPMLCESPDTHIIKRKSNVAVIQETYICDEESEKKLIDFG